MPWDRWQAPDRDTFKTLDKVEVAFGRQTRLLLQMEGAKGTVDAEVEARTGIQLPRARRSHKIPGAYGRSLFGRRRKHTSH